MTRRTEWPAETEEAAIARLQAEVNERLDELQKTDPEAVARIRLAQWHHLRSASPEHIVSLSWGPPTETIRDPRA